MRHADDVCDEDRRPDRHGPTHAVVQPDRVPFDMGPRQRSRTAVSVGERPSGWRPRRRSIQLRRSAAEARATLAAIWEAAKVSSWARNVRSSAVTISDTRLWPSAELGVPTTSGIGSAAIGGFPSRPTNDSARPARC